MVLHNPSNWHWVDKPCAPWAKQWFENELIGIDAKDDSATARISNVMSMDGDCDVCQRKGKVIAIYDLKLVLEYNGEIKEGGSTASGTITIPEIMHDTEEDEFAFEVDLKSELPKDDLIKQLARTKLLPKLRSKMVELAPALIAEHGKHIQHQPGQGPPTGFEKSRVTSHTQMSKGGLSQPSASTAQTTSSGQKVSVTTLNDTSEYRTSADELFTTFTDPQRIAAFTRNTPKVFEGAKFGGKFELFGGNVQGSFETLEPPTKIIQKWRLAQWPAGHFSTLKIKFTQNNEDHVTVMDVVWEGVPVGQEEPTMRNWKEYYVRSIKTTFGFGTVL